MRFGKGMDNRKVVGGRRFEGQQIYLGRGYTLITLVSSMMNGFVGDYC